MEIGRTPRVESVDELLEGLLLLGRTLQLKEHVLHGEIVRHCAAIVRGIGFGVSVAFERDTICFIDALNDPRPGPHA